MITVIVLAGGRSTRFGADKLAAVLPATGARPATSVLAATIRAVSGIADEVVVAGPTLPDDLAAGALAGAAAGELLITVLRDPEPFGGPLLALASVLANVEPQPHHVAVVVGGDMPRLVPAVLARMLDVLDSDPTIDAVYLGRPEPVDDLAAPRATAAEPSEPPRRQVLPLVVRVQPASRAAREAVEAGRRSLQALVDALAAVELPSTAWLPLDPAAATLTDIDTRADLDRLDAP